MMQEQHSIKAMKDLVMGAMVDSALDDMNLPHVLVINRGDGSQFFEGPFDNGLLAVHAAVRVEAELIEETRDFPGLPWKISVAPILPSRACADRVD